VDKKEEGKEVSIPNCFKDKVKPKKITAEELFLFRCPECGNVHFRHAGYLESVMPYLKADKTQHITTDSLCVNVCTKCKHCYVWYSDQMYDVTDMIDLKAWEKTEKELHKATGPGGQC